MLIHEDVRMRSGYKPVTINDLCEEIRQCLVGLTATEAAATFVEILAVLERRSSDQSHPGSS